MALELKLRSDLEREYCPPLDSATLLAILQDYEDLTDESQLKAARQTLDIIKEYAAAEEATGFDPSGSSGYLDQGHELEAVGRAENGSASTKSQNEWQSITDDTSLSQELSPLDTEADPHSYEQSTIWRTDSSGQNQLADVEKETLLAGIFPKMKIVDIRYALKRCNEVTDLAMDELLTQSFLEENGGIARGVEGFDEDNLGPTPKSKKKKKKKKVYSAEDTMNSPASDYSSESSRWDDGKREIDFISSRTGLDAHQVKSFYYQNGASQRKTIQAIVADHQKLGIEADDYILEKAEELSQEFPSIPITELTALLQLTNPSTASAHELAKALASSQTNNAKPRIQIEFRHAPIESEVHSPTTKPQSYNAVFMDGANNQMDASKAALIAAKYKDRRNAAFTQASAAYKRGKSDPLMGGAAAYYSQIGRDLDARAKNAASAAADALAAQQSTKLKLDLHGITVKDAVRISRERVTNWWHQLDEVRADGRSVGPGYTIVTGIGQHSDGGKGKLGPAVGKMLIREGWKVEVGSGVLVVTGRAQKR
ncbi:hypothetical protein F5884DRAFT_775378 [Xylogone sp. PMI_703]|nr:hypothetical protein F5884DRAFT_775378 [Xylogone sp. PMI_703]